MVARYVAYIYSVFQMAVATDTDRRVVIMVINKLYPPNDGRLATKYTIATEIH